MVILYILRHQQIFLVWFFMSFFHIKIKIYTAVCPFAKSSQGVVTHFADDFITLLLKVW